MASDQFWCSTEITTLARSLTGDANVAYLNARQISGVIRSSGPGLRKDAATNCTRWLLPGLIHCCGMKAGSVTHNPTEQE